MYKTKFSSPETFLSNPTPGRKLELPVSTYLRDKRQAKPQGGCMQDVSLQWNSNLEQNQQQIYVAGKLKLEMLTLKGIDSVNQLWDVGFNWVCLNHKKKHSWIHELQFYPSFPFPFDGSWWLSIPPFHRHPCTSHGGGTDQHAASRWKFLVLVGRKWTWHCSLDSVGSDGGNIFCAQEIARASRSVAFGSSEASLFCCLLSIRSDSWISFFLSSWRSVRSILFCN